MGAWFRPSTQEPRSIADQSFLYSPTMNWTSVTVTTDCLAYPSQLLEEISELKQHLER